MKDGLQAQFMSNEIGKKQVSSTLVVVMFKCMRPLTNEHRPAACELPLSSGPSSER